MSTFQSDFKTTTYGEYKATSSKGIKSQIYSSKKEELNIPEIPISVSTHLPQIKFTQILPVKVLPTISEEAFRNSQINTTGVNTELNSFNTVSNTTEEINTNFDFSNIQPTPTLDTAQTFEVNQDNTFSNNITLPEVKQDFNIVDTTSALQTEQTTETFGESDLQVTSKENILDVNNFQVPETTFDTNITSTNENIDLNTLATTNIGTTSVEPAQTFDTSTFQTTETTFDVNAIQETTNIDTNTYQTSEPTIDATTTTTTENFDINALSTDMTTNVDTNINYDINNIQTSEHYKC